MRRTATTLLVVSILAALAIPLCAAQMRGLWVDAFHPGYKSPEQTTEMVEKAKECGFNAIFVQVRRRGDVCFDSSVEPMASDVEAGYDPLADIVKKAHAVGIKVHAWISVYEVFLDSKWTKVQKNQVHVVHPEWLMKDERGRSTLASGKVYLDPGLPEVRQYLAGIIGEIVDNYEVDGIHLDTLRYPGENGGYNDASVELFKVESKAKDRPAPKDKAWGDWRRSQVTEFVRLAQKQTKDSKRRVELSAAVSPNTVDCYYAGFQDWVGWLRTGLLDFAVPMVFPTDNRVFESEVASAMKAAGPKTVYIGQGGWHMSVDQSLKQIDMALDAGAPGIVVYSYYYCKSPAKGAETAYLDALDSHLSTRGSK